MKNKKLTEDILYALAFADNAKEYLKKDNLWYAMACITELNDKCHEILVKMYKKEWKDFDDAVKLYGT